MDTVSKMKEDDVKKYLVKLFVILRPYKNQHNTYQAIVEELIHFRNTLKSQLFMEDEQDDVVISDITKQHDRENNILEALGGEAEVKAKGGIVAAINAYKDRFVAIEAELKDMKLKSVEDLAQMDRLTDALEKRNAKFDQQMIDLQQKTDKIEAMKVALQIPVADRATSDIVQVYEDLKNTMITDNARLEADRTANLKNISTLRGDLKRITDAVANSGTAATDNAKLAAAEAQLAVARSEVSAVQAQLATAQSERDDQKNYADAWNRRSRQSNIDADKLRTRIDELQAALHDRENSSAGDGLRIKTLEHDLKIMEQNYTIADRHAQTLLRTIDDLNSRLPGSAGSYGRHTPAASVYGSASSPSTDPPGLREDVVHLLQQLYKLKDFKFNQNVDLDLDNLIQNLANEIRSLFSDSQRQKALEHLFDLVYQTQPQTRSNSPNSDISDLLSRLRVHSTEPHNPDDERPTSSIGDDAMSSRSAPGRIGNKYSSAQPGRPAGGERAAGAGRSDSTDGAVVVASTDRGDKPASPPGEAAARSDSRASVDSLEQFHDAIYVPPAASTPGRGGKDSSAPPTAPATDRSKPRYFLDPNASPPKQRPVNKHRSGFDPRDSY
jgi:preprotein translocase subunit YajC